MPALSRGAALLLLAVVAAGCGRGEPPAHSAPDELAAQRTAVQNGDSQTIHVSMQIIRDEDLPALQVPGLRQLMLDNTRITDRGAQRLAGWQQLEHLRLRGAALSDEGVRALAGLPRLRILNLPQARFTDAGLAELKQLPHLQLLRFGSPHVTDVGMQHIAEMRSLRFLHMIAVPITDEGLRHLEGMQQLESLYLDDMNLSDQAIVRLIEALPKLHLHIDQQHHDRDPHRHPH